MQMLYDSDSFAVLHMEHDLGQIPQVTLSDGSTPIQALMRYGFEIVDKRTGKEVYLNGSWAEHFQREISAWHNHSACEEEVEAILDSYANLAQNPVLIH